MYWVTHGSASCKRVAPHANERDELGQREREAHDRKERYGGDGRGDKGVFAV